MASGLKLFSCRLPSLLILWFYKMISPKEWFQERFWKKHVLTCKSNFLLSYRNIRQRVPGSCVPKDTILTLGFCCMWNSCLVVKATHRRWCSCWLFFFLPFILPNAKEPSLYTVTTFFSSRPWKPPSLNGFSRYRSGSFHPLLFLPLGLKSYTYQKRKWRTLWWRKSYALQRSILRSWKYPSWFLQTTVMFMR